MFIDVREALGVYLTSDHSSTSRILRKLHFLQTALRQFHICITCHSVLNHQVPSSSPSETILTADTPVSCPVALLGGPRNRDGTGGTGF